MRVQNGKLVEGSYKDFLDLIYGNQLYIPKAIGYRFVGPKVMEGENYLRYECIQENMVTLMNNLQQVFPDALKFKRMYTNGDINCSIVLRSTPGIEYVTGVKDDGVLPNNKLIFTPLEAGTMSIALAVIDCRGIVTYEQAADLLRDKSLTSSGYVPMNNLFTMKDFVRICPPNDEGEVRVFLQGITEEYLNKLIERGSKSV